MSVGHFATLRRQRGSRGGPRLQCDPGTINYNMETNPVEPNLFDLRNEKDDVQISFSTSSFAGDPLLHFRRGDQIFSFRGEEIRAVATEFAVQVTVTIEAVPDTRSVTLTLLLPAINLPDGRESPVETLAIVTTSLTSIGGPRLVKGQIQSYETITLTGEAQAVDF